jgi:hypothetical protein
MICHFILDALAIPAFVIYPTKSGSKINFTEPGCCSNPKCLKLKETAFTIKIFTKLHKKGKACHGFVHNKTSLV